MADEVTATDKGGNFTPHDEGQFAAKCVDVVSLGQRIEQFTGKPARIVDKAVLVFLTDSSGETKEISQEFTLSMNEKSNLRKFLASWRGKDFTDEQVKAGVPLHKLCNVPALLSVEHKRSNKGRVYGHISSISSLPKAMTAPLGDEYKRQAFWADRKKQYAEEAAKWATQMAKDEPPLDESQADDTDDLPF